MPGINFNKLPEIRADISDPVDRQVAEQVFRQKLSGSEMLVDGFSLSNGDYAVYRLKNITPGGPASATEQQRQQVLGQLESRDGNTAYQLFREALRNNADVEIFESALEDDADILAVQ